MREYFERCRMLHTYGFFHEAYGFFSVAARVALFTFEAALGAAFIKHFPNGIPLARSKTKEVRVIHPGTYAEVVEALNDGWRVQGDNSFHSAGFHWEKFNGSMKSLLAWARAKGIIYGDRNAVIEEAMLHLRNLWAHLHSLTILTPIDSGRVIRDIAELIKSPVGPPDSSRSSL